MRCRRIIVLLAVLMLFASITGCAFPSSSTQRSLARSTPTHTSSTTLKTTLMATTTITPAPAAAEAFVPTPTRTANTGIPETISFFRLRFEYLTSSDWTTLEFSDVANILTLRHMQTMGDPTHAGVSLGELSLNQPLVETEAMPEVGMTVDYAISTQVLSRPMSIILRKGNIGVSSVRIYVLINGEAQLLQEMVHQGEIPNSGGENALPIRLDLSALSAVSLLQSQINRPSQKMVWAFYYPWYHLSDWASPILKDQPQMRYDSDDPQTIALQIEQAQGAGIDGFISSWWGPGDYTDDNLELLLSIAEEKGFSVSIYFETLAENGPRSADQILGWLRYAITQYGDQPAFFRVDGKPVIVIWASGTVPLEKWRYIFSKLEEEGLEAIYLAMGYDLTNLEVFDGIHQYGVFDIPNLEVVARSTGRVTRYYSLLSGRGETKIWVGTAQPGYDDRFIPDRDGQVQDRQNGQFYQGTFTAAMGSDPDWIFITTWNEWWEHTYIEPSEAYGDLYLQLTRQLATQWKGE